MSENSKIEWTDHTWSPWEGCQKVGPGCDHCYAEARNSRFGGGHAVNWGPGAPRREMSPAYWKQPLKWNAQAAAAGVPRRVFPSLCDPFDNAAHGVLRAKFFALIERTPWLTWLLLTKRIGNVRGMVPTAWLEVGGWPDNVWLGATVVNQEEADRDIPKLLAIRASVRFLSMEPLLERVTVFSLDGPIDVPDGMPSPLHWVIVGGESGPNARPMHPEWTRSLRDQCEAAGVPFLFKQWGEWRPISDMEDVEHSALYRSRVKAAFHEDQSALDDCYGRECTVDTGIVHSDGSLHGIAEPMAFLQGTGAMQTFKVGKKAAGRMLDGFEWNGVPTS